MAVTVGQIANAIADVLGTTTGINRTQSYDELTEGMNTLPTLQVYPESWVVSRDSDTDRLTFVKASTGQPGVRYTEMILHADLYVRQRSQLNEDWGEAVDLADALNTKMEEEGACDHFDLVGIKSFRWDAARVVFNYAQTLYTGFRFTITVRIF